MRIYYPSKFCMLLIVNHCKNHNVVINFDFSRRCQNSILETKKSMRVLHCFFKQFLSVHNCASVYSLALYRQVFLVHILNGCEGSLCFDPSPPRIFHSREHHGSPRTPWNFHDFSTNGPPYPLPLPEIPYP